MARSVWRYAAEMAGVILATFGAIEVLIGLVFLVLAGLFANPDSLPAWVDIGVVPDGASLRMLLLGVLVLAAATAQVVAGVALQRHATGAWPRSAGAALGVAGALVAVLAAASGGGINPIFLPVAAAYGFVAVSAGSQLRWGRSP
jgi:hypothetical protein